MSVFITNSVKKPFLYNFLHDIHQQGLALRTNGQFFKFTIKLKNLIIIEKREYRNSYLPQINLL